MSRFIFAAASVLIGVALTSGPAIAQDNNDTINALIVYGDDPCPVSTADQITVCARKDEGERYRIPEILRESQSPENDAWNNRVLAYEAVLDSGTLSCSPVGGGGWTGCTRQMIEQAYAERETDASVRFGELIADERARRLALIDEEAEVEQQEVEEAERAYFEDHDDAAESDESPEADAVTAP